MDKPTFINREGMTDDKEYISWLTDVKQRFRSAQTKAMVRVNTSMLEFYWSVGRDLVAMRPEEKWGEGIVKQFALDMRNAFPNEKGFSDTNVKYMRRWYAFYYQYIIIGHQAGDQLSGEFGHQAGDQLEMPSTFGKIPWRHHVYIFIKSKSLEEAFFYIKKTIEGNWSRRILEANITNNLYSSIGCAITNFTETLPIPQGQLADEILKDPYNFDFLSIQEGYDERVLEDALMTNLTRFLLELGEGFAFVGRQKELRMPDGSSFFPDLIFYHIPQHRYVVVDLKTVKFVPEFAGKINFYVTAADKLLKGSGDNQSVGLIICKAYDKTIVEWSLQGIDKPLGIATYQLQEVVERTVNEIELKKSKL